MAKCSLCNTRKGKRKCLATNTFICSLCCGESRTKDKCDGCSYYKDPKPHRNYTKVPHFGLQMMADNTELQDRANVIESSICQFDEHQNRDIIDDKITLRLTELLIDKYHFSDKELNFTSPLEESGFDLIDQAIRKELKKLSSEELSKILGTIRRSIKRHTKGHREYIDFIHQHVGIRIAKGIRAIRNLT